MMEYMQNSMMIRKMCLFRTLHQKDTEIIEDIILVLRMKNYHKATVIITTHDMQQARGLSGYLMVMNNGLILVA